MVVRILRNPRETDRFIAASQLGITVASLGLGMYGEHLLADWIASQLELTGITRWIAAHSLGSVLAVALLTYVHIVLGEMVPKSLALQHAEKTVLWTAPPIRVIELICYPLVFVLNSFGNGVLRLFGIRRDVSHVDFYSSPDELAYLVRESRKRGALPGESASVVLELLEFGELTARALMVPRVRIAAIPLGADADELQQLLLERPYTRYPVYDHTLDEVIGVAHVKDLMRVLTSGAPLSKDALRPVSYVPATARAEQVIRSLRDARAQMAVVLDEHGGTAGIVSVEDLMEEIVGEVGEDAMRQRELQQEADGRVRSAGTARIEDLGMMFGLKLDHEEVYTVSGLILSLLGRPPKVGDKVEYGALRLEVTAVSGFGVREAVVSRK